MNWVQRFPVRSNLNDTKISKFIGIVKVYICNCGISSFCRSSLACYAYGIKLGRRNTFFSVSFQTFHTVCIFEVSDAQNIFEWRNSILGNLKQF